MKNETKEKLAKSLTAENIALIPYLPYLLQDLWELGSTPNDMAALIRDNLSLSMPVKILDLACGKGAVSVTLANLLGVSIKGIDLIPEFISYAQEKAREYKVDQLCHFRVSDVNEAVNMEKNYDCVIFGAAGNVLGTPEETLTKLKKVIKSQGYILIDDAYLLSDDLSAAIQYENYEYLTYDQWELLFKQTKLRLAGQRSDHDNDERNDLELISARAAELIKQYPDQKELFEGYIKSQANEYYDLAHNIVGVTWLLQSVE